MGGKIYQRQLEVYNYNYDMLSVSAIYPLRMDGTEAVRERLV